MSTRSMPILTLAEMTPDTEGDTFLLLTSKEELTAKNGRPYYRVAFRDATQEVSFPIWDNSPWSVECRDNWCPGQFYKVRATYRETNFGPQLDIHRIREVTEADAADGFDPTRCQPGSRFEPEGMFETLIEVVNERITQQPLRQLVSTILETHRQALLNHPAARHNHHAFVAGLLEHTLSVTRTCLYLADKYAEYYDDMQPPLCVDLVVAGAILHDIGKVRELEHNPQGATYTAEGNLIGHLLLGRDMVREAAARQNGDAMVDEETLLRLEHILVAHQRLPEWGSPKPPMTPEALIVHYADDLDAKYHMMYAILRDDKNPGPVTSKKNVLVQPVFRGGGSKE